METDEISKRYIAPYFVNGLEAYDGEEPDLFEDDYEKTGKRSNDWDQLLDFNFDDVPKFAGSHLTQEEAEKEALAVRISQKFALLEEERPVIETMAYNDKYKKIHDEIWRDKVELDGKTVKEEEDALKRIKGDALKEKDDPGAFIFLISQDAKSRYNTRLAQFLPRHIYSPCIVNWDVLNQMGCDGETDDMLRIRVREAGSDEEMFTFVAWIRAFNINEPIYAKLCHEFYSTYEFDERTTRYEKIQKNDLWLLSMFDSRHQNGYANVAWVIAKWMKRKGAGIQKESQICCGQFISKLAKNCRVLTKDVVRSLSALIYYRDLDTTTLIDLIDSDGKLILEDPQLGVPRVSIPRPPRASMQDLYDRMGRMEIRQEAIEHIEYRQSYH
nr:hypothetical protein [Tanacetum cinerariifolium]